MLAGQVQIEAATGEAPGPSATNAELRRIKKLELQAQPRRRLAGELGERPQAPLGIALQLHSQIAKSDLGHSTALAHAADQIWQQGQPLNRHLRAI